MNFYRALRENLNSSKATLSSSLPRFAPFAILQHAVRQIIKICYDIAIIEKSAKLT